MTCTCVTPKRATKQFSALLAAEQNQKDAELDGRPDLLNGLELAVTIDDLFLWKGTPWPQGYSPYSVAKELTKSFSRMGMEGVYAFSATAPAAADKKLFRIFDDWVSAGHKIANHTHYHSNLNWVTPERFIDDIELGEANIEPWVTKGPMKFFRYGIDGRGETPEKYSHVKQYLQRNNYHIAPVSAWFYDTDFIAPHLRCMTCGDMDAVNLLRDAYVHTAIRQLRNSCRMAKVLTGKVPRMVFLLHATALTADCTERILERLAGLGVKFITLEEAMIDPFIHEDPPFLTDKFYNQTMKWAALKGLSLEESPPAILEQLNAIHPLSGPSTQQLFGEILQTIAADVGAADFVPIQH